LLKKAESPFLKVADYFARTVFMKGAKYMAKVVLWKDGAETQQYWTLTVLPVSEVEQLGIDAMNRSDTFPESLGTRKLVGYAGYDRVLVVIEEAEEERAFKWGVYPCRKTPAEVLQMFPEATRSMWKAQFGNLIDM
jgi:hypothetical protein